MSDSYRICACGMAGTKACERCKNNENKTFAIGNWTMSKYIKLEDAIDALVERVEIIDGAYSACAALRTLPTIEVSEGVIGQGSGNINWQAVTSTEQEIYANGFKEGQKDMLMFLLEGMGNALEKERTERREE